MTLSYTYNGSTLGFDIPPTKINIPQRAELGSISMGGVSPEDPSAALTLVGWKPFHVDESACSQPRLFTGYVADRHIGRSFEQTQWVGADARIHDVTVNDLNAVFMMRMITGSDGKRPEETMDARLAWLLASDYLDGTSGTLISDTGHVLTGLTLTMDAADYRGGFPDAVLNDLSGRSATLINYFAFWDPAPASGIARCGLFYDYVGAATYTCTISISNVASDVNHSTVFDPDREPEARLERTPETVYSDVIVNYAGGKSIHAYNASTASNFIRRGTTISRPYVGKSSTALAQGSAYLQGHATEVDRITCSITVPASVVGLIQAGMRMPVRFSHMPGYESAAFTSMRIVACTPTPTDDHASHYNVALELVAPRPTQSVLHQVVLASNVNVRTEGYNGFYFNPGGPHTLVWGGAGPTNLPLTGTNVPTVMQDTDGYTGTPGDWQFIGTISSVTIPAGLGGTYRVGFEHVNVCTAWWLCPSGPEGHPPAPHAVAYVPGHSQTSPGDGYPPATYSYDYDIRVNGVSVANYHGTGVGVATTTIGGNIDASGIVLADLDVVTVTVTWHDAWGVSNFCNACGMEEPSSLFAVFYLTYFGPAAATGGPIIPSLLGTQVIAETPTPTPTGTTVTFTLASAYLTGTLQVTVDGIVIPASQITETSPSAGTFTLSWAPDADEKITVSYLVG